MNDLLKKICDDKRDHIATLKAQRSFAQLDCDALAASPPRGFVASIHKKITQGDIAFITEIKKASPSAGVIRPDFSPASLARDYESADAACLSVLTDTPYFQGTNEDLIAARAACTIPVLRKDFMVDVWQVAESRTIGADCILIIMAAVDDALAKDLHQTACQYGMDVLIETHDRTELDRALKLPSGLIGVNNRNLKTLKIDLAITEELAPHIPANRILVCESGIRNATDIQRMRAVNAHCFLVGESLLKQGDVRAAVAALRT